MWADWGLSANSVVITVKSCVSVASAALKKYARSPAFCRTNKSGRMNDFSNSEFDFAFLEEGFSARDILESKINEVSHSTEIQMVQSLDVPVEKIIYANPCKQLSQIKYAATHGVQMMTFDSEVELMKVARGHPSAKLVLRIAADDSKAICRLSVKFGATLKTSRLLLERAKELGIDIIGV
eukprot:g37046.t1